MKLKSHENSGGQFPPEIRSHQINFLLLIHVFINLESYLEAAKRDGSTSHVFKDIVQYFS